MNKIIAEPEHARENRCKYPAAAEDAYAATQWVMQNARQLGGDESRVAIAGESPGGNLAAVTCLRARDEVGRMPVAQLLVYPVTNYAFDTPSYRESVETRPLNAGMMKWFWGHYLENESQGREAYASPLQAQSLQGLPPAIVITDEFDPLRDEGEAYAKRLADGECRLTSNASTG